MDSIEFGCSGRLARFQLRHQIRVLARDDELFEMACHGATCHEHRVSGVAGWGYEDNPAGVFRRVGQGGVGGGERPAAFEGAWVAEHAEDHAAARQYCFGPGASAGRDRRNATVAALRCVGSEGRGRSGACDRSP
jgi:hypothetical protein